MENITFMTVIHALGQKLLVKILSIVLTSIETVIF